jgi:hypothetical protein
MYAEYSVLKLIQDLFLGLLVECPHWHKSMNELAELTTVAVNARLQSKKIDGQMHGGPI